MTNHIEAWDDTIVALATAPGMGAIAVIRLSGNKAIDIINELFPSKNLLNQKSHTLHVGIIKFGIDDIDEVVISIYKNPKSYTGEDVIEISCHGSPFIQQKIIQACISKGARLAKAGEFTKRAFLSGKLDLTQAEAVADIIASNTLASQKSALHNMRGGFSEILKNLRENLIQFSALLELELDFSQEDIEFADRRKLYELIETAETITKDLLQSFQLGNVIKNGVSVAIIGKPNAGKSTLLNALLNENRAIVSEIAGTTRDTVEETINIDGILFRLIDTAGIRENSTDVIELIGIEKTREKILQSDEVIYLFDVNTETVEDIETAKKLIEHANKNFILVGNKSDLMDEKRMKEYFSNYGIIYISAKQLFKIDDLKRILVNKVVQGNINTEDTVITNTRHFEALEEVHKSLYDIKTGLDDNISGDLLALDIRRCLQYISEITGDITNEHVLDYIFSKFCIGK
ncbi:MAG TPA: tRNA uridine-5-carboxymethylaminomethyl(34) synthesis GTPase MnmE [Bacteroidia bacterium]|nr:tRNA uridine-5-carboxymethylaminomethyl(34) synthesis GTPase MnmE [Ferruginibacter sp.]HRB26718.1 tRNA uridine-5-carboxymethylaminomethyl(34) synthesis GTPase MnmE [Bacteroidia bacterium]